MPPKRRAATTAKAKAAVAPAKRKAPAAKTGLSYYSPFTILKYILLSCS
jgi:hypothetical protein